MHVTHMHEESYENAKHMVMECPYLIGNRTRMSDEFNKACPGMEQGITFGLMLGKCIDGWELDQMIPIWSISCTFITKMYYDVLNARKT